MSRSAKEQDSAKSRSQPEGLPKRWSAQRKAEVVLRLLRGEDDHPWARTARAGIYFRQRIGGMTGMSDSVNGPAKLPPFNAVLPLFKHDRPGSRPRGKNGRSCSPG